MWWSDFERMLGEINYPHLIKTYNGSSLGFMKIRNLLINGLSPHFGAWIKSLNCSVPIDKSLCISSDSLFFSFNYTLLLENSYHLRENNIWHIHNSVREVDKIIVGHDYDERTLNALFLKNKELHGTCFVGDIVREVAYGAKHVVRIINSNKGLFLRLYQNIKHYKVMGFSFNEFDLPYIEEIIKVNSNLHQADWTLYYHRNGEDEEMIDKLIKLGIERVAINNPVQW